MKQFTLERDFDAPIDEVWRAWTDPDQVGAWLHSAGGHTPRESIRFDVRPGGEYRYTMVNDETGSRYPTGGVFREVQEPTRLVFTWGHPDDDPDAAPVITLDLAPQGTGTRLTLHLAAIEDIPDPMDTLIRQGWATGFDQLGELLTGAAARR